MTNKINVVLGLVTVVALTLGLGLANFANAATYQYVNTSGQIGSVVANTPLEALATASRIAVNSGVILVSGNTNTINNNQTVQGQGNYLYQFINTSGQLSSIRANTPQEALTTALNLGLHSGVILVK